MCLCAFILMHVNWTLIASHLHNFTLSFSLYHFLFRLLSTLDHRRQCTLTHIETKQNKKKNRQNKENRNQILLIVVIFLCNVFSIFFWRVFPSPQKRMCCFFLLSNVLHIHAYKRTHRQTLLSIFSVAGELLPRNVCRVEYSHAFSRCTITSNAWIRSYYAIYIRCMRWRWI